MCNLKQMCGYILLITLAKICIVSIPNKKLQ